MRSCFVDGSESVTPPLISLTRDDSPSQQSFLLKEFKEHHDKKDISLAARDLGYFTTESFHSSVYHLAQLIDGYRSVSDVVVFMIECTAIGSFGECNIYLFI